MDADASPGSRAVRSLMAVAALCFAAAPPARAQLSLELMPFTGYSIAGDVYQNTGARVGLASSLLWGLRLSAIPNARLGLEFAYTRTGSDLTLDDLQGSQPHDDFGRMSIASYDITFLSFFRSRRPSLKPFAAVGLGLSTVRPDIHPDFTSPGPQPESRTLLTFAFGLGAKIRIAPRANLRIEGRWRSINTHMRGPEPLWCDPRGYCYEYTSSWYRTGELIGGITIRLR